MQRHYGRGWVGRSAAIVVVVSWLIGGMPTHALAATSSKVAVADAIVTEGDAGTTTMQFTLTLNPKRGPMTVHWATAAGTSTAGSDYTTSSGTASLSKSVPTVQVNVPVLGDTIDEDNETLFVNLSSPVGGQIADPQGIGTITDNDALPALSINDASPAEGNAGTSNSTFTVTLGPASGRTVTVNWATANGSATAGSDYVAASGALSFPAGAVSRTVTVAINGDVLDESNEGFSLNLATPVNATIADGTGAGTIVDDDAAPTLSVNDVTRAEGNAGTSTATFTVTMSGQSASTVTVDYATQNGSASAGSDYAVAGGTLSFPTGTATRTVSVTINGDAIDEADETFTVVLSNAANATIADGTGAGTIADDDAAPTLSINDVAKVEGNAGISTMTFTVTMSGQSASTVTVDYATQNGSASAGSDYLAATGTLSFPTGTATRTVSVTINGDPGYEPDESFTVVLGNPVFATIADGTGSGTITTDDTPPTATINDVSIVEGNAGNTGLSFTVTLSSASLVSTSVDWATANDTATAGQDYVASTGTLTIPAGVTTGGVDVQIVGELSYEPDETFHVVLSAPVYATIADGTGVGTITNDDVLPTLSVLDGSVSESAGSAAVTVQLSAPSAWTVTVHAATGDGTALQPGDYAETQSDLTIDPGTSAGTFLVPLVGDTTDEPNETVGVTLTSPVGATLLDDTGVLTIRDDDKTPTSLTMKLTKKPATVRVRGVLEIAVAGLKLKVSLYHRTRSGGWARVRTATVTVKHLGDRDGDGKPDATYSVTWTRPATHGWYKAVAVFAGTSQLMNRSIFKKIQL